MKIHRLELRAFGPFTDVILDLSGGREGFHLIYGPNEAGKSSALRALRNLLYGIPGNTSDHFVHDYRSLRIGATLARRDGQQLAFVRRKGYKGTLLSGDEKESLDEAVLHGFLGGCDQAQFETMFGIDHPGLIAGGRDIVRGQGDIGHVLFAAGAGISDLRAIRNNLESQAEELFSPRGLKPAVNQALTELTKAKKLFRESLLPSSEWQKHKSALDDLTARLAAVEDELSELARQRAKLQRLERALPAMGRLREYDNKLAAMADVRLLPPDFAENRRETMSRSETARQVEQESAAEIARLDALIAALAVPDALVSRAAEIESVYKEASVFRKAQADLPGLLANRDRLREEAAILLQELRPDLTLADAEQVRLTRRQQIEIQGLGNRKEAPEKQLAQARTEITACRQRLAEAVEQLALLPPPTDAAPLAEAVRHARSQGNLCQQAAALRAEIAALEEQAAIDLDKLGLWSGTLGALERLGLPAVETIARFDRCIAEAKSAIAGLRAQRERASSDATGVDRELEGLRLAGEVPSEVELADARRLRESGWHLVRNDWRKEPLEAADLDSFLAAAGGNRDLAAAYEDAVRRADDLSDRLRREANRVAKRANLQAQRLALQQQTAELSSQYAAAETQLQQVETHWRQAWQPAGIDPLPPREMLAWTQRQQTLVQQAQTVRQRTASLEQMDQRIAAHCRQLRACLNVFTGAPVANALHGVASETFGNATEGVLNSGETWDATQASLDGLLARSDSILEQVKETTESRRHWEREKNRLAKALTEAESKAARAEAEINEWQAQWTAAIQPLRLPGASTPAAVNEVVAQTVELFTRLKESTGYAERIDGIGREGLRFRAEVERLLRAIDPDCSATGDQLPQTLEDVVVRLRRAIVDQKKRDLLQSQLATQTEKRQQARSTLDTLQARLAVLCQEAGCADAAGLLAAEAASAEVLRLQGERQACQAQLLELAAGATIEALKSEAAAISPDSIPGELRGLADAIAEMERTRGELREAIGGEKTVLAAMDTSGKAAEAAEEVQDILARLEPDVQEYLRLRLGSAVLREGIERYRKKNEGPVLGRASELFQRLTLGSFAALRIDFDEDGEQVLAGVRPDGGSVLPQAMSEGTSDQLYLALRLASLEIWLRQGEPMPFIVDDILVSFDNRRATATLEILAELSVQTQVVFFTHHEHLVELAAKSMQDDVLFVHRL